MTTTHDGATRFYTLADLATMLRVSHRTAQHMAARRTIPGRVQFSARCVRYSRPAVDAWIASLEGEADGHEDGHGSAIPKGRPRRVVD